MSRSSSISSTSGFVTPQGSILSLPLQDENDAQITRGSSCAKAGDQDSRKLKDPVVIEASSVRDDSNSTHTDVTTDAKYMPKSSSTSTPEPFLEHLSNSAKSSFNESDRMEEELAELGIYDSELLEDSSSESENADDEDWQDLEEAQLAGTGSSGLGGKMKSKKKAKWKEAEEELRRGGNRSLAEMWPSSFSFFRHSNVVAQLPEYLVILLPLVVFLVIGRTTEIVKAGGLAIIEPKIPLDTAQLNDLATTLTASLTDVRKRRNPDGSTSTVNAGTAVTMITLLFTPHIRTLPIHSTLINTSRRWFPGAALSASGILVALCLPFAMVPYYLLAKEPSSYMPSLRGIERLAGIFKVIQVGRTEPDDSNRAIEEGFKTDNWLNFARVCIITLIMHNIVLWISHAKDVSLRTLGIKREGRAKAQRWLSASFWLIVTGIACIGGRLANRLEWLGAACVLSVGWLLPAILFIKTFHLANPLSIVFPSEKNPYQVVSDSGLAMLDVNGPEDTQLQDRDTTMNLSGPETMQDPSTDLLLARKERQLQKRRSGRRMWQDLIVFLGILPMGTFTVLWCVGVTVGLVSA
ncbi:hypothetical protein QFC21_004691 [Naganishia friedmannii]|uniref:Uncharacterized protein n=1 Tax=Naganishia friedmannii TaxID=89922 RepID=A0ACC2VEX9_9TREE|nr:hypothetical protein QFC21_004691 [Naganishia friedmannii]